MERRYTRLDTVRELVDQAISSVRDEETKRCAYVHLYGVGLMASLLAINAVLTAELQSLPESQACSMIS